MLDVRAEVFVRMVYHSGSYESAACAKEIVMESGMVHIYCGDGKGKTSAAVGLAARAAGAGLSVLFAQFLKTGDSAELAALERVGGVDVVLPARSFGFVWTLSDAQKDQMREVYAGFWRELTARAVRYDVLVADELLDAINLGLVDLAEAVAWLHGRPAGLEVVLTGRDPAPELVELADYVSEVKKVKHPFDRGVAARRGIEY